MVVVLVGYWWCRSGGGVAGDRICNGGSCNRCRSTMVLVVVTVLVLVVEVVGQMVVVVVVGYW